MSWAFNIPFKVERGAPLPYDAEVEYLKVEAVGPYIDTGINILGATVRTEIDLMSFETTTNKWAFGSYNESIPYPNNYNYIVGSNGGWCFAGYENRMYKPGAAMDANVRHSFRINWSGASYFDGSKFLDGDIAKQTDYTSNAFLFASHRSTQGTNVPYSRFNLLCAVYSLKMWRDGVMVLDFVPVRVGTVGYMYDRVSGELFGNSGTGEFIIGPDI